MKIKDIEDMGMSQIESQGVTVDLTYLTHKQVGRKRMNLFNKKFHFQS